MSARNLPRFARPPDFYLRPCNRCGSLHDTHRGGARREFCSPRCAILSRVRIRGRFA